MREKLIEVKMLQEQKGLEIIKYYNREFLSNKIKHPRAQKPGLALTGYVEYLTTDRIQLFGKTEIGYLSQLKEQECMNTLKKYFSKKLPAIIVSESQKIIEPIRIVTKKYKTPIMVSSLSTSILNSRISQFLYRYFSKKIRINGTMMDIMGRGVFITGSSGIGKSETALELINKGYQLVSDDVAEFYLNSWDEPVGRSVKPIKQWLEVRGLGVINIMNLYGVSAILDEKKLDLVINLEKWNPKKKYDRLGENRLFFKILGKEIHQFTLPVAPGRNVSSLIEVAVKYYLSMLNGNLSFIEYSDLINSNV
jgi:HPr kinase/phosphorylase